MKKGFAYAAAVVLFAATMNLTVLTGPSAAGDCADPKPGCGGEVDNNSTFSVSISNCWESVYGTWENGDNLPCHGNPPRVGNKAKARVWLSPGQREDQYSAFYDTDAVKFPAGCTTYYHYWGQPKEWHDEDRHGKDSIWLKISDIDHFYFDRISC
ncbi:hypothetical protein STRCI_008067 [Streptomyces cinnabarinus]|uniref:Secreted protein n=1 Tax=Streptomyces cinnabarinus TaxID=67287 RepID=A0ABY7KS88_9ACTN|nr:hypothetical protein [Streptomyces cinnabarinus]WAZ26485.1 hypothetical protein STRCI_008067 [Streptomyces cinnabarinus]